MIIDRSKHNKFVANSTYTDLINRTQSSGKDSTTSSTSGNIIYVGGGGESGNIDSDLIEELRNQEAFSYLNVSDGTNTEKVEAKIEKDYMNLNFVGDSESTETKVSSGRYLPETYFEATGTKSGNYNLSYEQISVPEIVDEKPVEIIKWRIVLKKVFGNPIFPNTDFTGIELLKEDISLGVYDLDDKRVTVSSDDTTGLSQIIILQDKDLDFDKLQLVKQVGAKNEVVTTISNISIQTYITVLITQAGAARFWKLDEHNKLYTDYDAYSNKTLGAKDMIWSNKGYKVGNFVQGISGGVFYISDKLGTTYIEADKLRVRKKAYFETLEIVNVNTVGGKQIISPGGAVTIRKVEEFDDYYRCYFLGRQDDVVVENRFRINDLAFSQNFNIKEPGEYEQVANHYFWRLVVGVSTNVDANDNHYIDLSKTDCDLNSDIPHVNDVIAQLGNRTDTDRQSALIFSSVDVESPRIILCSGISTYTLTATDRFDLGVNHTNNQAYMNVYGNAYIGAKDQSSYMSYSVENGLSIKGNLDISSTIGDKSFSDVFVTSENFEETVNAVIGDELEYLQNQIDGNIESYFYDYSPTLENYPASEWADEQIKTRHIGDTFTNIQEYVDDETTPDAGKSWRWVKSAEGVWGWTPIADSDAVLALKKAGQAQDTADGKRRVFVQQPTDMDVYDVGDLWVNATYSDSNVTYTDDLLRAKTSKAKGHPFNIKHWTLASNYKNLAEDAIAAAEEAGEAANNAQQSINNYKNEINSVFQDGIITTSEASRLRTLVDTINTTLVDAQKTYEEVYNNGALDNKSQKTELASAFSAFDTAADNLIQIVTEIVNKATTQSYTITKADISNVDNAYSIFNTKYADYIIALNAANLEIMNTLSNNAYANAVNAFGWLNGLFDPDQKTTIEGAVVTTGVLALGKTTDGVFTVNAGINGVENNSYLGNGIAIWFGGDMIDKDNYSAGQRPENTASSLFRFDGSGYLGYKPNSDASRDDAPIWWDTQGNLHANPLSFFVGETTVGFLLSAFQPVDSNEDGDADYLIQHIPFQTLQIGSAYLGYDAVNKAVYVYTLEDDGSTNVCNFYATGEVTAYGSSDGSSMPTVINYLYELRDVNWGIGTKPSNADTMIMWNGETWLYVNKNEVGLNEKQLEQYLTENGYAKKSDITNDVNAVSVTGSGNAVTSASVSGHTLTLTKGSTFLLSSAYTAADILTKLKTVDGSNSGLDADTVDGKHLADILASNVASATKLQTARLIWGRSFDGTNDISGDIKNVGNIYGTGRIYINSHGNIALRYNNDDTKSIALTDTSFKPFSTATNKIDLGSSTDRWRNLYVGSNADITGNTIIGGKLSVTGLITASAGLTTTNYIQIGNGRIYWDQKNKALYVKSSDGTSAINFYSTGEVTAYGSNSESGGGSTSYDRLDDWNDYSEDKSGYVLSAGLGWDLNSRIKDIESNGILNINTTGSGNVVTNISKSGTVITVTKGITALTSVNLATITDLHSTWDSVLKNAKPTTLSGYGIQASDVLNTIKTVDGHNSGLNADLLDGWHLSEFYRPFDGSKTYGGSFSAGAQDTGWKKLCDVIIPETGTYKGVIIDGNISYGRTNHAAAVFIKTPFQIVFYADGTDTARHNVYLYIPKYFTHDAIQVVKLDEYNYQVQIRQFSSYHSVYAFFQTKTYGGTRTVPYNKIETASDGEVIRNIANASVMVEDSAYTATKLKTPRKIWGQNFDGTANVKGNMTDVGSITATGAISTTSYIQIGKGRIYWDETNKALYVKYNDGNSAINFYSLGEITAYGSSSSSGGGGGVNYDRLDDWSEYTSDKAGYVLSAKLGWDLNTRIEELEAGSALNITTTGTGNAVTGITKNNNTLTVNKSNTFLLASQYTATDILNKLKTVDGSNSGLDADLLDGTHKTGLLTALTTSDSTNLSITVGGTTKTIANLYADSVDGYHNYTDGFSYKHVLTATINPSLDSCIKIALDTSYFNYKYRFLLNFNYDNIQGLLYLDCNAFENAFGNGITYYTTRYNGINILSISKKFVNQERKLYLYCKLKTSTKGTTSATVRCYSPLNGTIEQVTEVPTDLNFTDVVDNAIFNYKFIGNFLGNVTGNVTGNADTVTKLKTPRLIWGQSFDGTANVSGNLSGVGSIIFSNDGYIRNAETYIGFYTVDGKAKGIKAKTLYLGTTYANEPSYTLHVGGTLGVDSTARIGGALTSVGLITASAGLTTSQYIQIGDGRIYWDATNKALYVKHKDGSTAINFYATGEITAYGSSSSSGGGGGTSYDRLDSWDDYESGKAGYVLSAGLGWDLNTRVKSLEGGSALTVTTTGRGNVITSISKSGTTITANKGITALTSVNIATISDLNSGWDSLLKAAPSIYVTRHPSISEVTNKQNLVIKLNNGTTEGTNLFTYNVTAAKTINITASSIGAAASSHSHSWSNITSGKPTTLSGYGITDAYTKNASDSRYVNVSGDTMTGMLKVSSGGIICTTSTNNGVRLTGDSRGGWVQFGTMDADPTNKVGVISAYAGVDLTSLDVRIANNGFTINSNPILHTGNYTSTLDGRYVKKSGDTMTGPLKINGTTDQLIVIDSNRTPYIEFKLNGSRQAVFGGSNNVPSVYTNTWHKIWHAGNDGPESELNADLLDDYHYNEFESYKKVVIDASALNENTWYPVTMLIGNSLQTRIRIEGNTSAEASWNSRSDKMMSLILDYTVNGCYWGWTNVNRVIYQYIEGQGTSSCLRGLGQLTNSSTEYVFVRGGAVYNFYVSRFIEPVLRSSTYTVSGQSVSPTTTMPDAITINNALITSNVASATKLKNPRNIWGQSFDGTNNVSGSMTSVTAINDNIYFNNLKTIIVTSVITASQDSQWRSRSVCIANSNTVAYGMNIWSNGDGTGHIQVGRTAGTVTYYDFILQEYGGNVGIGTKSPSQKLHVNGNILATGEVTAYSDQRLKSNIEPLVYRGRLNPKSYIKDNKQSIGFIAQDVQELYPELVMETGGDNNYLSLNYGNITAVLSAQINTVEDEVTILKRRVKELEDKLEAYESSITTSI